MKSGITWCPEYEKMFYYYVDLYSTVEITPSYNELQQDC